MTNIERMYCELYKPVYESFVAQYDFMPGDLPGEKWKTIPHSEGYKCSTFGRVKKSDKILKPECNMHGYLEVAVNGINLEVGRLVAELYIPNPMKKPVVKHLFGRFNNHVKSLAWAKEIDYSTEQILYIRENPHKLKLRELAELFGTRVSDISAIQLGKRYKEAGGPLREKVSVANAKLSTENVLYIRANPDKMPTSELAKKFGVSVTTIKKVQRGEVYKTIGGAIRTEHGKRKIKGYERDYIRAKYAAGAATQRELAEEFGVSQAAIAHILSKKPLVEIIYI